MKSRLKLISLAAAVGLGLAGPAQASEPLTMIVPFSAGGSTDILARVLDKQIGQALQVPVVVANKPGAEGFIAARELRNARPDGNTLMLVTTSVYAINPAIFSEIPYDSAQDFTTVSVVASSPNVILAAENSRYSNLKDLLAASSKDDLDYATGATMHLLNAKWLEALSGARMTSVPYKGSAAAYPDLIAGRVDFMVDQPLSSMPFIQQGKLKVLAVTSEKRWPRMPDVPTVAEQGFPDFSTTSWWAVLAPAATPREVVQKLHDTIAKGLAQPDIQEKIHQIGADIESMSLPQAQAYTAAELEKWKGIAKAANVKMN